MLNVKIYRNGGREFLRALTAENIEYQLYMTRAYEPHASGQVVQVIEAIAGAMPWASIARVIEKWVAARAYREVIITTQDNQIFHAKGYSAAQIREMLAQSKDVQVIDTKPNEET